MADENKNEEGTPKASDAPEGFWEDFQGFLMGTFAAHKANQGGATPPPAKEEGKTEEKQEAPKKERKSWFTLEG